MMEDAMTGPAIRSIQEFLSGSTVACVDAQAAMVPGANRAAKAHTFLLSRSQFGRAAIKPRVVQRPANVARAPDLVRPGSEATA